MTTVRTRTRPQKRLRRISSRWISASLVIGAIALGFPTTASATPAFARKYATSCLTCHTIFPKLNPFGEAFRRNGFRFPGTDSEMVKQPVVPLGADAYKKLYPDAVWPSVLPGFPPLALGFNGQVVFHPDTNSGGGKADNGAAVNADDLIEEGHLWAGGSFDDAITFYSELTVNADGISVERATVMFEDLIGPAHAVNISVGKGFATLLSFAPHSTYIADTSLPPVSTTALFGATSDSWNLSDDVFETLEVNGVIGGNLDYSAGITNGSNSELRTPTNVYLHLGAKFGGMRLDGENSTVPDPAKPWAETSLTLDGFFFHSASRFTIPDPASTMAAPLPDQVRDDTANVVGGHARGMLGSAELDVGVTYESHSNPSTGGGAKVLTQFNELSYVLYPWLVPAIHFEYTRLSPDGSPVMSDSRLSLGAAALVRPNIKFVLTGQLEAANGLPPGGWGGVGGVAAPADATSSAGLEVESVVLFMQYVY